jgi:hypothetical protein
MANMTNLNALVYFIFYLSVLLNKLAANTLDASNTVGSFIITSAWLGVLVRKRRTSHWSRLLASNMANEAGGTVRLIKRIHTASIKPCTMYLFVSCQLAPARAGHFPKPGWLIRVNAWPSNGFG